VPPSGGAAALEYGSQMFVLLPACRCCEETPQVARIPPVHRCASCDEPCCDPDCGKPHSGRRVRMKRIRLSFIPDSVYASRAAGLRA
jgi:hypothetical protein